MGSFEFLARPFRVNLLLLVPFVAYSLFRRGRPRLTGRELFAAAIFALSFAFVKATVAIYLGAAVGLVQGDGGTFSNILQLSGTLSAHAGWLGNLMPNLFAVEQFREAATILVLVSVAILAEPKRTERFAVFLWIFAIWDIGYYAALWMTVRWPASLTNADVLFFIPVPWTSQVWFPILVKHPDRGRRPADTTLRARAPRPENQDLLVAGSACESCNLRLEGVSLWLTGRGQG